MAKYGNIMTVFNSDQQTKDDIESILSNKQADYVLIDETFFIETNSKKNTGEIIKEIKNKNIEFIFFHNHISDGSKIKSDGVESDILNHIDKILLK